MGLQRTERAALACEIAAQGMEEACEELEKASEVLWHANTPRTVHAYIYLADQARRLHLKV